MFRKLSLSLGVVVSLALSAVAAHAFTVVSGPDAGLGVSPPAQSFSAGDEVTFTGFVTSGVGTVDFTFTANTAARIFGFSVSGVGRIVDLDNVTFALDNGVGGDSTFDITPNMPAPTPPTGFGGGFIDDFVMSAGETVTLTFTEVATMEAALQIGAFFQTEAIVPIPLPAAFPMLALALGGLVVMRSRKTAAAA